MVAYCLALPLTPKARPVVLCSGGGIKYPKEVQRLQCYVQKRRVSRSGERFLVTLKLSNRF